MSELTFKPIMPLANILLAIMLVIVLINGKHIVNRILIIILLFIINQRPMLKNKIDVTYALNLNVAFVIDTTVSMNAVDVDNGTRLDVAKNICKEIMEYFPGAQYEIITYDNEALMKYPFTSDNAAVASMINSLRIINPFYAVGSSLTMPIEFLNMSLQSEAEHSKYHNEKRQNIVFIIGDGELDNEEKLNTNFDEYKELSKMIDDGAVIGIGTKKGGKILITKDDVKDKKTGAVARKYSSIVDENGYLVVNSETKEPAISIYGEDNLKELANKLNLDFFNASENKLNGLLNEIKEDAMHNQDDKEKKDKDIHYYFSIPLLFLLIYELYYYRRNVS